MEPNLLYPVSDGEHVTDSDNVTALHNCSNSVVLNEYWFGSGHRFNCNTFFICMGNHMVSSAIWE